MSERSRQGLLIAAIACGLLGLITAPMMGVPGWVGFLQMALLGGLSYVMGYSVG